MLEMVRSTIERIERIPNVVVLTGAGISAESGIKTFRDHNGLWENHNIEEVASPRAFATKPELVYRFYNQRRAQAKTCAPNRAHIALTRLEQELRDHFFLVTQNVDNLHELAGSKRIRHMHGRLDRTRCIGCGGQQEWDGDLDEQNRCGDCNGQLRPHIVWFGEIPLFMDEIHQKIEDCDIFVAIGTSGVVYPAAGFSVLASQHGALTIEVNLQRTALSFDEHVIGPATTGAEALVQSILFGMAEIPHPS